jgi:hypothetical protein
MRELGRTVMLSLVSVMIGCEDPEQGAAILEGSLAAAPDLANHPDYVSTPIGLLPRSCVHAAPKGAEIRKKADGGHDVIVGGKVVNTIPPCLFPPPPTVTNPDWKAWDEKAAPTNQYGYNWYRYVGAGFTVPAKPTSNGQTIYYFPGLSDSGYSTILQPVLQFGVSGCGGNINEWNMCNWWCSSPTNCIPDPNITAVNVGDIVYTDTYASSGCNSTGTSCTWKTQYYINGGALHTYTVTPGLAFKVAFKGVMEVQNRQGDCGPNTLAFTDAEVSEPGPGLTDYYDVQTPASSWTTGTHSGCTYGATEGDNGASVTLTSM